MINWTDPGTWAETVFEAVSGESLSMDERLVLAPCKGRLRLALPQEFAEGEYVIEGQAVANVISPDGRQVPIRSPFAGWVMGFLVADGAPVRDSEPVLWLRRL